MSGRFFAIFNNVSVKGDSTKANQAFENSEVQRLLSCLVIAAYLPIFPQFERSLPPFFQWFVLILRLHSYTSFDLHTVLLESGSSLSPLSFSPEFPFSFLCVRTSR